MSDTRAKKRFRSQEWFDNPNNPGMTALYVERYQNQAFTRDEIQSDRPIIGVAQTGSDLAPCNKIHVFLMDRIKAGIRDGGGIPIEFPVHPIQETGKRPTAALDRNLAYLSLVEVLHGYPIDGVVLTTGCDKTTPAMLMGAATVDIPAITLNGGPMLDGWWQGKRAGSGTIVWQAREMLAVEIERTWSEVQESYAQILLTRRSVTSAAENLRQNRNFYQAGTAPLTDLLDAETLYTQSRNNLTSAYAAYHTSLAKYMRVTGR